MNSNYYYKYWDDDNATSFMETYFGGRINDAYNCLYAGACKADIFRLCLLYIYGGIWTDISAVCEYPMDLIIKEEEDLIICCDEPSQNHCGNVYQAFIISKPKNPIIKFILDYTVSRVLKYDYFNQQYHIVHKHPGGLDDQTLAITGPTIFAIGLNAYLKRDISTKFKEGYIHTHDNLK